MLPENVQNMLKFDVHNHPSAIKGNIIMAAWMRASILIFSVILIYVDLFSIFKIKFESSSQQKVLTHTQNNSANNISSYAMHPKSVYFILKLETPLTYNSLWSLYY